jgi:hypothetical protein
MFPCLLLGLSLTLGQSPAASLGPPAAQQQVPSYAGPPSQAGARPDPEGAIRTRFSMDRPVGRQFLAGWECRHALFPGPT